MRLFALPPKSPKLHAHVERSNRTDNEEFYEVQAESDQLPVLNRQLLRWERTYNCVRPTLVVAGLPHRAGIHHPLEAESPKGKVSLILDEYIG